MESLVVWKKTPLVVVGVVVACGLSFWIARATAPSPPVPAPLVTSIPAVVEEKSSATDWFRCVEGNTTPKKGFTDVMLRNRCSVVLEPFVVHFKLYDLSDARVGWDQMKVGTLESGEKVRFRLEYDLKANPKLADGIGRVAVYDFQPNNE